MARILAVGIATLDIINTVTDYPAEDSEVRAHSQSVRRGGNATNTLTVLSQLGHACSWAGVLVETAASEFIREELAASGIDTAHCRRLATGQMPTSYIALSEATGSRTIVHYRDLPEFDFAQFASIDLSAFDWLHFEGRNVEQTARMLAHARAKAPRVPCSVEIEKPRDQIDRLFKEAGLLLFSRHYATAMGATSAEEFLDRHRVANTDCVIAWGAQGAWMATASGERLHAPATNIERVVDSLGAGDTFNAAVIGARLRGLGWSETLTQACRLAGKKCTQYGLKGLVNE